MRRTGDRSSCVRMRGGRRRFRAGGFIRKSGVAVCRWLACSGSAYPEPRKPHARGWKEAST
eukprot:112681-Chlamydomonas_euryale.AAC.1